MKSELNFIKGAIAKKDFIPQLTHVVIKDKKIISTNGKLTLCSPFPLDIYACPKGDIFIKAINSCEETINISVGKKLTIKSGKFKAQIECIEDLGLHTEPEGDLIPLPNTDLLEAFGTLSPVIGDDATRPWSNGILLSKQYCYATNNIVAVRYDLQKKFPITVNIPESAIKEILRIKKIPWGIQYTDKSLSFLYEDGSWIKTCLLDLSWPNIDSLLEKDCNLIPINSKIFKALEVLKPFLNTKENNKFFMVNNTIRTSNDVWQGADYDIDNLNSIGIYSADMFNLLKDLAKKIDLTTYPNPCLFSGENIKGAIIGMKF